MDIFLQKDMKNQKKKRLIIRNLSFQVSEKELCDIFSKFGNVTEVTIPVKEDGKKRGFAFVQFEATSSMIKAMKALNYSDIKGRRIAIDYSINKTNFKLKKQNMEQTVEDKEFLDNESDVEENGKIKELEPSISAPFQKFLHRKKSNDLREGKTVFLRNVNCTTSKDALNEAMKIYGECDYCAICINPYTYHSKGSAFVKFKDKKSADKLIADSANETGVLIDGQKLMCCLAVSKKTLSTQKNNCVKKPKDKRSQARRRNYFS